MGNTVISERIGRKPRIPPEPIEPAMTKYIDAGVLTIAVEPRHLTLDSLRQSYSGNVQHVALLEEELAPAIAAGRIPEDVGVSLHVLDSTDRYEYLRFDCFKGSPHYHYIFPIEADGTINHQTCPFDSVSNGLMLDWALERISSHLPDMLSAAGAGHLVAGLNQAELDAAVDKARAAALSVAV
jgi:hypothetical protein